MSPAQGHDILKFDFECQLMGFMEVGNMEVY